MFGDICDKIFIEHIIPMWSGYKELENMFNITHDKGLHGRAIRQVDIWNGEKYRKFLLGMLLKGRRENHAACASCEYPCYDVTDYLDDHKNELIKALAESYPHT